MDSRGKQVLAIACFIPITLLLTVLVLLRWAFFNDDDTSQAYDLY